MSEQALARTQAQRPLPAPIVELVGQNLPEPIVRAALETEFRGMPIEQVARVLHKCVVTGLNPLTQHVVQFRPKRDGDPWPKPFVTAEGRIFIANRHPDFAGITFSAPRISNDIVTIDAFVHRKSWKVPLGPVTGSAPTQIKPRNGDPFPDEHAVTKARTRAVRTALRYAFGDFLPDPDAIFESGDGPDAPMRADQRRTLFAIAGEQGWSREERHARATAVLGRPVDSWASFTESEAAQLELAWGELAAGEIIDVDPETGEIAGGPVRPIEEPPSAPPPAQDDISSSSPAKAADRPPAPSPARKAAKARRSQQMPPDGASVERSGLAADPAGVDEPSAPPEAAEVGATDVSAPIVPSSDPADDSDRDALTLEIKELLDRLYGPTISGPRTEWIRARFDELGLPSSTKADDLTIEQLISIRDHAVADAEASAEW